MSEKRSEPRIPIDAKVRIRPAGASGRTVTCSVCDSSGDGIRVRCLEEVDPAWYWIEVLPSAGAPTEAPLAARVIWRETDAEGYQQLGCQFAE
jgi:hypothetical protein